MASFALSASRRHQTVRRNLSTIGLGLALFVGSLVAMRLRPQSWLFALGAGGALLLVVGARRLLLGVRPLAVGKNAVWFGTRGVPLHQIEAVEISGDRLELVRSGGARIGEELQEPAMAAAEIARSAGLRPPRKGGPQRWEKRTETQE